MTNLQKLNLAMETLGETERYKDLTRVSEKTALKYSNIGGSDFGSVEIKIDGTKIEIGDEDVFKINNRYYFGALED